jgi:hypothetical protein
MLTIMLGIKKAFKQGDLLSLLLFNVVSDILVTLINSAKADMQICGGGATSGRG